MIFFILFLCVLGRASIAVIYSHGIRRDRLIALWIVTTPAFGMVGRSEPAPVIAMSAAMSAAIIALDAIGGKTFVSGNIHDFLQVSVIIFTKNSH